MNDLTSLSAFPAKGMDGSGAGNKFFGVRPTGGQVVFLTDAQRDFMIF